MPQLQTEVPDPLRDDLPGFLPASGLRTPAIGILLAIFVAQGGFKGTPMQIQRYDIRCSKGFLRQLRA